jgi:ankyrin repeat protein
MTIPTTVEVMSYAAANNVAGLTAFLEDGRASVPDHTTAGWTPLHIAAASGHTESCRHLLAHGTDVTSTGRIGLAPLHLARLYGYLDVIQALV